jgi:cytochrome oxidase assembly protein ShyY1
MVEVGFWQLRRLHIVRADNARVRATMALPAAPLESILGPGASASAARYRRVTVTGRYDRVSEVDLANRSFEGSPGSHRLTPLRPSAGPAIIVDRGWVPLDASAAREESARPPVLVPVTVVGVLFPSERKSLFAPTIAPTGRLTTIPRIDVARIAKQLPYSAYPLYLRLESQTPAQGELPVPPGPPDLSEGPHLSYAVQWFIFAAIAAGTYLALLRRDLRRRRSAASIAD